MSPYFAVQGVVAECNPFALPAPALPPAAEDLPLRIPAEDSPLPPPARAFRGRIVGRGASTLIGLGIVFRLILSAAARDAAMAMGSAVGWVVVVEVGTGLRFKFSGIGAGPVASAPCFSGVVFADVAGVVVAVADALALGLVVALPVVIVPTRGA